MRVAKKNFAVKTQVIFGMCHFIAEEEKKK
jgi:hypothetical protein